MVLQLPDPARASFCKWSGQESDFPRSVHSGFSKGLEGQGKASRIFSLWLRGVKGPASGAPEPCLAGTVSV